MNNNADLSDVKTAITNGQQRAANVKYHNIVNGYQAALQIVDDVVLKNYIGNLTKMPVVPLSKDILENNIKNNVLFFKITEMVYEKEEFATYKFASVFNSLATTESAVFVIIDSDGIKTDFYMGVRSLDSERTTSSLRDTVENAMKGQFPGIKTTDYTIEEMESILEKIQANSISSVSCVANSKAHTIESNKNFVQGLEKLVLSMQGEKYTGIIIANGTTSDQLRELRKGYESVYTQMSPFATTQVNYMGNKTVNYTFTETEGKSRSTSHTTNSSESETETTSSGSSITNGESKESVAGKTLKGISSAASIIGAALGPLTGGMSLAVGGVVAGGVGLLGNAVQKTVSNSTTVNESISHSIAKVSGVSDGITEGVNYGTSKSEGYTNGMSEGMTLTLHDKSVETMLERIDKQLKRIDEFESLGMYECAAYFLSENQYAAEVAASTYKALMRGENSGVEISAVNSWGKSEKEITKQIGQYVTNFIHPVFRYEGTAGNIEVTPCSLVSGSELAIHMGLPRRSVCGLPVIEHADFGKEVVTYGRASKGASINLGKVFNMGSTSENAVRLDINTLSMHTFITGSTGSGKSNTVYELARQLDANGKNYLIIEPAKGEYKNVFGLLPDVKVYGTNPYYEPLLKINPFKFPKGIHILEHIDRLVEIFNVCWPMYAAMPAVLKDALLQAYRVCGWNLVNSKNMYSDDLYPTFQDLLAELVDVIKNSAYSEEVKSNYMGSLVTRVKSLTNGLNGQIFAAKEIDNKILFDKKTIIDLSRIGSMETKSLIMGILIMRLSEYRMTSNYEMNQPLKHVTILEEAHNILKKVSTEQNSEGANVAGKSVEMISNAIAEMRTYGEGFIIVDQSPSAVDISAIRNTNTKIIMRLPDEQDRRMAGKSAGLKDEQLDEIAKLPKGVAVVYQNDWVEPVLCSIQKFRGEEGRYQYVFEGTEENATALFKTKILELLLKYRVNDPIDNDIDEVIELLNDADIAVKNKLVLRKLLNTCKKTEDLPMWKDDNFEELSGVVTEILDGALKTKSAIECSQDYDELTNHLMKYIAEETEDLPRSFALAASQCLMKNESVDNKESRDIYAAWITHLRNKSVL